MIRLAETLVAFLWQGALIACLLASSNLILRRAATRYAAACAALAALFLFPLATFWRLDPSAVERQSALASDFPASTAAASPGAEAATGRGVFPLPRFPAGTERGIVLVWLVGVLALSVRLAGGWAAAGQLRRQGIAEPEASWVERAARIARRLGLTRPVRLLASTLVNVPTTFGAILPMVLLPAAAFTALPVKELEALLAHELAHVRRHDYMVNLLQSVAETLFFYHPAVWWVSHRLRVERENACDDLAVAATGSVTVYARALLDLEETRVAAPLLTVASNGGLLSSRIARLLLRSESAGRGPRVLPLLLGLATGLALLFAARAPQAGAVSLPVAAAPVAAADEALPSVPSVPSVPSPAVIKARPPVPRVPAPPASSPSQATPATAPAAVTAPSPIESESVAAIEAATPAAPVPATPKSPAVPVLTPAQLIAFRIHGVTPEFVEEIRAFGFPRVTADELIQMRIHGVTPGFAREMRAEGVATDISQLVSFRIQGVTPGFLHEMRSLGFPRLSAQDAVNFRIHGVTPGFVRDIRDLGYASASPEDFISMRIHGVTAGYVREMNRRFGEKLSLSDLVGSRIYGVKGDDR